jgi:inorganic pyrophosphatase/exopolyphosphatase
MGIKGNEAQQPVPSNSVDEIQKMQKKAFEYMDKEYEYARVTTHLNRGKGWLSRFRDLLHSCKNFQIFNFVKLFFKVLVLLRMHQI